MELVLVFQLQRNIDGRLFISVMSQGVESGLDQWGSLLSWKPISKFLRPEDFISRHQNTLCQTINGMG